MHDRFYKSEICPRCGLVGEYSGGMKCVYCNHEVYLLKGVNFKGFNHLRGKPYKTKVERDEIRFQFQPKERYDERAWLCREHFEESCEKFGIPGEIWGTKHQRTVLKYQEDNIQEKCPYCGSYFTDKASLFDRFISFGKKCYCFTCKKSF